MRFEWDEAKNISNQEKHGINFNDVVDMFNHPMMTIPDTRVDYGEERWIGIGWITAMLGVVVYVERDGDATRIISARKANKHEISRYEKST